MISEAAVFRALADPTRRQILQELKGGELAAGDIRILYRLDADHLALTITDFVSAVCPAQIRLRRRASRRTAP